VPLLNADHCACYSVRPLSLECDNCREDAESAASFCSTFDSFDAGMMFRLPLAHAGWYPGCGCSMQLAAGLSKGGIKQILPTHCTVQHSVSLYQ
jgi:hypothetical protein